MSYSLVLINALSFACWDNKKPQKKKRKEKWQGGFFFPRAGG
jgi:hypothetical protein